MTTFEAPLTKAMREGLRAFYFHTTSSYTGGEAGTVERLNEMGGTLHGQYNWTPGMRKQTMDALQRRGLVVEHYDPRSAHGPQHFQLTASGHAIVRNLLTAAEVVEIDTYWQEQAMAEDLIREQLASEESWPGDLSRTEERGIRYWVDNRMREGFQDVREALSAVGMPTDYDSVRRELTRRLAARHRWSTQPTQSVVRTEQRAGRVLRDAKIVSFGPVLEPPHPDWAIQSVTPVEDQSEADERGELHRNRFAGPAHRELTYVEELQALSLPELIDRYARTYHRAANQPNNAELASMCSLLKQLVGRALEGWVPLDDIESWCDR